MLWSMPPLEAIEGVWAAVAVIEELIQCRRTEGFDTCILRIAKSRDTE